MTRKYSDLYAQGSHMRVRHPVFVDGVRIPDVDYIALGWTGPLQPLLQQYGGASFLFRNVYNDEDRILLLKYGFKYVGRACERTLTNA